MGCGGSTAVHQTGTGGEAVGGLVAVVPDGPHQGVPPAQSPAAAHGVTKQQQEAIANKEANKGFAILFGSKHLMLTYQWDTQEQVKAVRELLKSHGIPTWMDIDGGMQTDIYDSMAEGVGGAAVVVPFMTAKYQASENCSLELKFAKQTGVPIVPVMMQSGGWAPSGWLGLLTAGTLWTPLHDKATLAQNVDGLIHQIKLALGSDDEQTVNDMQEDEPDAFSAKELRDELDRLAEEQQSASPSQAAKPDEKAAAKISAAVPQLPIGVLVTGAMTELLKILTDSATTRVGFFGMGGIGKSVVSSWLVRHDSVREMFDHIVWVTLGQTPDTASVQSLAYSQLTGSKFSTDEREEQRSVSLQQAMQDKKLLLVLDDIWDASHEKLVNFIDEDCGAKVLLSSRVRGVLAGSKSKSTKNLEDDARMTESIIDIGLPSEDDAIKMLLATADLSIDGELPLEARELVRFCKMLPLTISIAGKLVKEVDIQEAADWEGVVEMMKDEFAENDEQRTVEETVISVSMKSIRGGHAKNVMHLFKSLALLPEDAVVPVEIVSIMFHSVHGDDGSSMKCPSVPLTRRWLKQLIDRSLVLGTVDRPALHDIVGEFVAAQHSKEELQQAHRRMVDQLCAARPVDAATGSSEWCNAGDTMKSRYVRYRCAYHIQHGWNSDWAGDEHAISTWLGSFPQDDIVANATVVLGSEKVSQLALKAESSSDKWHYVKLASLAGDCLRRNGDLAMGDMWRKALDTLAELAEGAPTEQRNDRERLELELMNKVFTLSNPTDFARMPRLQKLLQTAPISMDKCFGFYWPGNVAVLMGNVEGFGEAWLPFPETMAEAVRTYPDDRTRHLMANLLMTTIPYELTVDHEHSGTGSRSLDWDGVYGENGALCRMSMDTYNYDIHHEKIKSLCFGNDLILVGLASRLLAFHWGDFVSANNWQDKMMLLMLEKLLTAPKKSQEQLCIMNTCIFQAEYAVATGRVEKVVPALRQVGYTWEMADKLIDDIAAVTPLFRPRGDTTMGLNVITVEHFAWLCKLSYIMCAGDHGVATDEVMAALPSIEEMIPMVNAGLPHSWGQFLASSYNLFALAAEVCEKLGQCERGLVYAEHASTCRDIAKGGAMQPNVHSRGNRAKGRCLAAQGAMAEAEAAFELAAHIPVKGGQYLYEVLALRDLKLLVLDQDGRGAEGSARLKTAIERLMGDNITDKAQLAELAIMLGDKVDLPELLK